MYRLDRHKVFQGKSTGNPLEKVPTSRPSALRARKPPKTIQETSTGAYGAIGVAEEPPNIKISKFAKKNILDFLQILKKLFLKSKFRDEKIFFEKFRSHFRVLCLN